MSTSYYDRKPTLADGQSAFANSRDHANEEHVRAIIEAAWKVKMHRYGAHFAAIDWYCVRAGNIVAHIELKSRSHDSGRYETVFLNVRKWMSLTMAWLHMDVPSYFIVKFTDEIRWIDVSQIDARKVRLGGCNRIVKAKSDVEPVIEVPVGQMNTLKLKAKKHE